MSCRRGTFSRQEQLWMQISFHGVWILGAWAMGSASLPLAAGYVVAFPLFGVMFCVMRLWVCPRCPHLEAHGSCVQAPASWSKWIVGKPLRTPLTLPEKVGFFVALYGVALVPLYWVIQRPPLLAPYLLLALMHFSGYFVHLCRRCLNLQCPQHPGPRAERHR